MSKSLADLRAAKPKSRPERSHTVCLVPHLVAEVGTLTEELQSVAVKLEDVEGRLPSEDGEKSGPPKRGGGGPEVRKLRAERDALKSRLDEIRARLGGLLDEMAEHEGEVRVAAIDDGDWRRWVNENPAREKDEAGHKRDLEVAGGYCNADALIDDLGRYASAWNGEPLEDGDWAVLSANIGLADKKQLANLVVSMHEMAMSIPKWRSALSASLESEPA